MEKQDIALDLTFKHLHNYINDGLIVLYDSLNKLDSYPIRCSWYKDNKLANSLIYVPDILYFEYNGKSFIIPYVSNLDDDYSFNLDYENGDIAFTNVIERGYYMSETKYKSFIISPTRLVLFKIIYTFNRNELDYVKMLDKYYNYNMVINDKVLYKTNREYYFYFFLIKYNNKTYNLSNVNGKDPRIDLIQFINDINFPYISHLKYEKDRFPLEFFEDGRIMFLNIRIKGKEISVTYGPKRTIVLLDDITILCSFSPYETVTSPSRFGKECHCNKVFEIIDKFNDNKVDIHYCNSNQCCNEDKQIKIDNSSQIENELEKDSFWEQFEVN